MTNVITPDQMEEGMGTMLIADAALLVRPRQIPGAYPASVKHDTAHANQILNLGNDMGAYRWHIATNLGVDAAHKLLDRVFYAYVDACCLELWCDAFVHYIGADGEVLRSEGYGFEDGNYTMHFYVYTASYWDHLDPATSNWNDLIVRVTGRDMPRHIVGVSELESFLAASHWAGADPIVLVQPGDHPGEPVIQLHNR